MPTFLRTSRILSKIFLITFLGHLINVIHTINNNDDGKNSETSLFRSITNADNMVDINNNFLDSNIEKNRLVPVYNSPIRRETRGGGKQHYCGENLIKVLALSCKGHYNNKRASLVLYNNDLDGIYQNKGRYGYEQNSQVDNQQTNVNDDSDWLDFLESLRNTASYYHDNDDSIDRFNNDNNHYGSSSSYLFNSLFKNWNNSNNRVKMRPKRGIVEECCKRLCGLKTLNQYCGIRKRMSL